MGFSVDNIRAHFPFLKEKKSLVYFDNAATTQKPKTVLDAINKYYCFQNSNVHRGVHKTSQLATDLFEESRCATANFVNAAHSHEIIFTSGTTSSINLLAHCLAAFSLEEKDEVLVSQMEHHSNIVPWQLVCEQKKATLKTIPFNAKGELCLEKLDDLLSEKTKIVAVSHASNSLGTINNIKLIASKTHAVGGILVVDGAQAAPHIKIDVRLLGCDFYCFSAHKMYGPTGVGVLYGKENLLEKMPPYQGGGEMIKDVSFNKTTFADLPHKYEAGTPNIAGVIGFKEALDFVSNIGYHAIEQHETLLFDYAEKELKKIGCFFYGSSKKRVSLLSFLVDKAHPYDFGIILDNLNVAVRTGHHCTQPVMDFYGIPGTVRASFAIYNTMEEVDVFINACVKAKKMLV